MLKCFLFIRKSLQIFSNQWLVLVIDASKASLTTMVRETRWSVYLVMC